MLKLKKIWSDFLAYGNKTWYGLKFFVWLGLGLLVCSTAFWFFFGKNKRSKSWK